MYKKLNALLTKQDKKFLILLVIFSIFVASIETIGVAAIMPFISLASNFTLISTNVYYQTVYSFFGFENDIHFVIAFGISLIFFYLFRSLLNLIYYYNLAKFSKGRIHVLAFKLFENYLGMPYKLFVNKNTSELTKNIISETQYLTTLIFSLLLMISETFVIIFIYAAMIYMNWQVALLITFILLLNALFLIKTVSKRMKKQGYIRAEFQKRFYEIINSTFSNFKMVKLQSKDTKIIDRFQDASLNLTRSNILAETFSHFPRLFLEAVGFGLMALLIVYLVYAQQRDISSSLGMLSMYVLGLYRLMPSANRILTGYNQIQYTHKSLDLIHSDLMYDVEKHGHSPIEFKFQLQLENVTFGYDEHKMILKNVNVTVKQGDRIAIIGPSGSGKSTLVDIMIGLYKPVEGQITIDDVELNDENIKAWRDKVGYIPQQVYLFDGTVAENVGFGHSYDEKRVKEALQQANILEFLEKHQQGIQTIVGEGGIKLSGGQKQRIAIARALYQNPEILVLDEATSALDTDTESLIMDEIYELSKNKTLFIIAHRLSTIGGCNRILKVEDQVVIEEQP